MPRVGTRRNNKWGTGKGKEVLSVYVGTKTLLRAYRGGKWAQERNRRRKERRHFAEFYKEACFDMRASLQQSKQIKEVVKHVYKTMQDGHPVVGRGRNAGIVRRILSRTNPSDRS